MTIVPLLGCVTANIPKLVSNGPNGAPATVLLQSQSGHNILLPPGVKQLAPGGGQVVRQVSAAGAQVVRQGGQVMVRAPQPQAGQSPVLVQIPPGNNQQTLETAWNNEMELVSTKSICW